MVMLEHNSGHLWTVGKQNGFTNSMCWGGLRITCADRLFKCKYASDSTNETSDSSCHLQKIIEVWLHIKSQLTLWKSTKWKLSNILFGSVSSNLVIMFHGPSPTPTLKSRNCTEFLTARSPTEKIISDIYHSVTKVEFSCTQKRFCLLLYICTSN